MPKSLILTPALLLLIACGSSGGASGVAPADTSQNTDAAAKPIPTVPENSPITDIKNVPATTGKANRAETAPPFNIETIGDFDEPFAMAFLPDGSLLVTEKAGHLQLRNPDGNVQEVAGAPTVAVGGQGGLLDVALAPDFAQSRTIYLTYSEPGTGGSQLALGRGTLASHGGSGQGPRLNNFTVIWRSGETGPGGQFGANILFAPDGKSLFLSSGERQRFTPAQDPNQALGKILHLTLDGKAAPGNPMAAKGGVEAMTWTSGHRNPYGMVIAPDGRFWEVEMGPRGGDELNLIKPGQNYGWPLVSNGDNYSGQPIPDHPSRPDFAAPVLWWNPSISPGGMIQYSGAMFPEYKGNLFIGALSGEALIRVVLNGDKATAADQWDMGTRIRDLAQAPDGAIWALEDGGKGAGGRLLRLTPKR
jgi:glucose/arabinose dehydrogenase